MENDFGKGAVETPKDEKIAMYSQIIGDTSLFDWETGFDITNKIGQINPKNQMSSSSCGGQSSSYLSYVLSKLQDTNSKEKSARWIYAPVAVSGGGSSQLSLMKRLESVGSASEELVRSYRLDGSTDEAFMTSQSDFDNTDTQDASNFKSLNRVYIDLDWDTFAKAIRDNGGIVLGIYGKNNGTWTSKFPQPPKQSDTGLWCHWIFAGKAITIEGKRYIGLLNSWGNVGENGWQYISEDYLPFIFTAWGFTSITNKPSDNFTKDLYLGVEDLEVNKLQELLKKLGYFPSNVKTTNYFGNITQSSLIKFQKDYNIFPQRGYCGIKTRTELNKIKIATMTNIQFRWDKFFITVLASSATYIGANLGNIDWSIGYKAGLIALGTGLIQYLFTILKNNI